MSMSLRHRLGLAALLAALLALGPGSCGGGDTSGLDSPEPRSFEYQQEGWCYRWVPQGQVDLDKAMKTCQEKVKQRQKYLKDALGPSFEKGPTAWNLEACLQVLGWERCPPSE